MSWDWASFFIGLAVGQGIRTVLDPTLTRLGIMLRDRIARRA